MLAVRTREYLDNLTTEDFTKDEFNSLENEGYSEEDFHYLDMETLCVNNI